MVRGFLTLPRVTLAAVLFFSPLLAAVAWADVAIPTLKARVTDLTATLTVEQTSALESKLAAFEQRKGSQLAVLLVPTTQPETVEQYSIRVTDQWKLGRKGVDDGVLLLIAKDDRKLRIEVGRGLEGALPDAIGKRIIDEYIVAPFKQGDFNGGVNAGVDRIIKVVDGEPLPAPKAAKSNGSGASSGINMQDSLGWGALLVVFLGGILRAIFGVFVGSLIAGVVAGVAAVFLGVGAVFSFVAGIVVFVLSLIGISFFGGGGGGSSVGSWGGGGGGFGGGGASGSW